MSKRIPISRLGELLYCEYKLYLKYKKKVKTKPSTKMIKGKIEHKKLHTENKIKRKEIADKKQKYKKIVKDIKKLPIKKVEKKKLIESVEKPPEDNIFREFAVVGERLRGRIDEIIFDKDTITIVDDKPHNIAYDTDKIQVWGYCLSYKQQFSKMLKDRKLIAAVRNWKTKKVCWKEEYSSSDEKKVLDAIDRIDGILYGTITPIPTDDIRKCRNCDMRKICDKKPHDAWGGLIV